jgi:hypothetical protein
MGVARESCLRFIATSMPGGFVCLAQGRNRVDAFISIAHIRRQTPPEKTPPPRRLTVAILAIGFTPTTTAKS